MKLFYLYYDFLTGVHDVFIFHDYQKPVSYNTLLFEFKLVISITQLCYLRLFYLTCPDYYLYKLFLDNLINISSNYIPIILYFHL